MSKIIKDFLQFSAKNRLKTDKIFPNLLKSSLFTPPLYRKTQNPPRQFSSKKNIAANKSSPPIILSYRRA